MSSWSLNWWFGQAAHNLLNLSQYSCKLSPLNCLMPLISFRIATALDAGKYFSRKVFFNCIQEVMLWGWIAKNQSLAPPSREKGKALSLICSFVIFYGLIVAQTMWKACKFSLGSSPVSPWNLGNKWMNPDLSSKSTVNSGYVIPRGWWVRSRATNSFIVRWAIRSYVFLCKSNNLSLACLRRLWKVRSISRSM